ncbi:MAG: 2-C-methyl-D-erythritol 2,4-cyclodiphosphate synthase [Alistipes sp.]|nr:2-C-methyl-D-erythritol 2,4-cyclodiphosphate synthase [Alistipes sp.]
MMNFRIGYGYDVHALADGLRLVLGGVEIEHSKGCVAHSDGDVAIHAICDALLGAAALGDIGLHFPDTSDDFAGIDSRILLRRTAALLAERGYRVGNIDCTIAMQRPKLRPHIDAMRAALAADMNIAVDCVSVKATTTERLGFEGREEGVSASAAALIYRTDSEAQSATAPARQRQQ